MRLGDELGLRTVAEGIEYDEQLAALQHLGCTLGQGYLFGAFYKTIWRKNMDTTTLLIIIVVLLLLGGGWYGRGRWY